MISYADFGGIFLFIIQSSIMFAEAYGGVIIMSVSVATYFSYKQSKLPSLITAVVGSLALFPAVWFLCLYYIYGADIITRIIAAALLTALIVFYDIMVIKKYIKQKKNKSTEEQNG